MFRLRYALAAVALATSGVGCAVFWDDAHEFPIPGKFAAIPGSYTGPPLQGDAQYREAGYGGSSAAGGGYAPQGDPGASVPAPPPVSESPAPFTPPAY